MRAPRSLLLAGILAILPGCRARTGQAAEPDRAADIAQRRARFALRLAATAGGDSADAPLARWLLPTSLSEISGLAVAPDGRLFAHDDNVGRITVIDPRVGEVLKQFSIGLHDVHADFEGITRVRGTLWLLASNSVLYEFEEGPDRARVPYTMHDLRLGHECEFEGVAYDSTANALVLPCKVVRTKRLRDSVVLYRWSLERSASPRLTMLAIPQKTLTAGTSLHELRPSGITIDPATGDYVVVAADEKALVEITPAGALVHVVPLPRGHTQAEGVELTADSVLIVSDEGRRRPAAITLYRWPLPARLPTR